MEPVHSEPLSLPLECGADPGAGANYALSYIQLCGISYQVVPASIPQLVANPNYVTPWYGGRWACVWGPAVDDENANLAYVAAEYDSGGRPIATVVVLRGTDVTDNVLGDLWEAFEDLQVAVQYPLPWMSNSPAQVAGGTLDALTTIQGMLSGGATLREFLTAFLGRSRTGLVVTGHSLGGCLASVLAPWLSLALRSNGIAVSVLPVTYAAPTAGNGAFAAYLGSMFPNGRRYYNSLDMVPHGWSDLGGVKRLYDEYGLSTPLWVNGLIDVWQDAIWAGGASYVQPGGAGRLPGTFCLQFDWLDEISTQHDHRTYISLLQGANPTCYKAAMRRNQTYTPEERQAALGGVAETAVITAIPEPPAAG